MRLGTEHDVSVTAKKFAVRREKIEGHHMIGTIFRVVTKSRMERKEKRKKNEVRLSCDIISVVYSTS